MPPGERSNQTKRFDTHWSTDEISDISSTKNSSSLLHDKLYEVRMHKIPEKDRSDCVQYPYLARGITILIDLKYILVFQQNSILRKEIEHLVYDNYGVVQNKLQQLQTNRNVAQIYFQESVVSMQAAKSTSDELLSSLEQLNETAKSITFPSKKNAGFC